MIIGSGSLIHNFEEFKWGAMQPEPWAMEHEEWLQARIISWNTKELWDYKNSSNKYGLKAAPTPEYFIPLVYPMGAEDREKKPTLLHKEFVYGSFLYTIYKFD